MNEQATLKRRRRELVVGFVLVAGMVAIPTPSIANEGSMQELTALCRGANRPDPGSSAVNTCLTCHTNTEGSGPLNASGKVYKSATTPNILSHFCPTSVETDAGVFYNRKLDGELPPTWAPSAPERDDYRGLLEVYWLTEFSSDMESHSVTSSRAEALSAGPLVASPDNCWGHSMNFGLIRLQQPATLTISMSSEARSGINPGFALYQGWDIGKDASRHAPIYFGVEDSRPLGTTGLRFLGDKLGTAPDSTITARYNLLAGDYELFVTVGDNNSSSGAYRLDLKTTPFGDGDSDEAGHGQCGKANDARFANPASPAPAELCQAGQAGPVSKAANGRLTWTCKGIQAAAVNTQCYTLGTNQKRNQPPLFLIPGHASIKSGQTLQQTALGGRADGKVGYKQLKSARGVKCKLTVRKDVATLRGTGEGVCTLYATKTGSAQFNDVRSGPVEIRVTR